MNNNDLALEAKKWQEQEEHASLQHFYWSQKTIRTLRFLLRLGLVAVPMVYGVIFLQHVAFFRKDQPSIITKKIPIQAIGRLRLFPLPKGVDPISVLDLDTITPELCASNLAAIEERNYSQLHGRLVTKTKSNAITWVKEKGNEITLIDTRVPIDLSLAGRLNDFKILSLTKTTLANSIALREGDQPQKGSNEVGVFLFPVFRDGKNIYCFDLAASLPLDGNLAVTPNLPSVSDTTSIVDTAALQRIKRKSLEEAEPGDFINSTLMLKVDSVDSQGKILGHFLNTSMQPTEKTIEIISAAHVSSLQAGKGAKYDDNYALQLIQKDPLIIINRSGPCVLRNAP
jgi:hypothetical protein